jgi:hypothetical protein
VSATVTSPPLSSAPESDEELLPELLDDAASGAESWSPPSREVKEGTLPPHAMPNAQETPSPIHRVHPRPLIEEPLLAPARAILPLASGGRQATDDCEATC